MGTVPVFGAGSAQGASRPAGDVPALSLVSQSPWVTPTAPWFSLSVAIGHGGPALGDLHVAVTIYSRLSNASQLQQAIGGTPDKSVLTRVSDLKVTNAQGGRVVATCITVLPNDESAAPTPAPGTIGACPADGPTVTLGCMSGDGSCGDVYPVSVALFRSGSNTPLQRFTTFLTYVEPNVESSTGGALRVSLVVPVSGTGGVVVAAALAAHRSVAATLAVNPATVSAVEAHGGKADLGAATDADQVLSMPYRSINLAALISAGLSGEVAAQVARGDQLLRQGGLRPAGTTWVDTASNLTSGSAGPLAVGLIKVGASHLVVNDSDLSAGGSDQSTFAQPFALELGHNIHIAAVAADSQLDSRFTADPGDPNLAANQLLAGLAFVHFENAFFSDPRGMVLVPPAPWRVSVAFVTTLLNGLTANPVLSPVTLNQLFAAVPQGGNGEPSTRHLQAGTGTGAISAGAANHILVDRQHLSSFMASVAGHPAVLTHLSDQLLSVEAQGLNVAERTAAITGFTKDFDAEVSKVTLATERTITFTSQTAPIPITVLSSAPFPVTVVLTLTSDKFVFPTAAPRPCTSITPARRCGCRPRPARRVTASPLRSRCARRTVSC